MNNFFELKGKIITAIVGLKDESQTVDIHTKDGYIYRLEHIQDCCEYVRVFNFVGDANDIYGSEIVLAEDDNPMDNPFAPEYKAYEHNTWTVFKLVAANESSLEIWWLGESNGYYSENVNFNKIV